MVPIWLCAFLLALVTFNLAVISPKQEAAQSTLTAEVTATRILAYRQALKDYLAANPSAENSIQDDQLAKYWPTGCVQLSAKTKPSIKNIVQNGIPYVYNESDLPSGTLTALWKKRRPFPVGTKLGSGPTARLYSPEGAVSGVKLPSDIPSGAVVLVM